MKKTKERFKQWQKLTSHYVCAGKEMYHEWEQKGIKIRNQRLYERVK